MKRSRFDRALDYLPIVAFLLFWLEGGVVCSLMTRDAGLMRLPSVTIPSLVLMIFALKKIGERSKLSDSEDAD